MRISVLLKLPAVLLSLSALVCLSGGVMLTMAAPTMQSPEMFSQSRAAGGTPAPKVPSSTPPSSRATPPAPPEPEVCKPTDCNGDFVVSSLDVNGDCKVTEQDTDVVARYVAGRPGDTPVNSDNRHLDANVDGVINAQDDLSIRYYLYKTACLETPTPTPTFTSSATLTSTPTSTAAATLTATPTASPVPTCEFVKTSLDMLRFEATGSVKDVFSGMTTGSSCVNSVITDLNRCVGKQTGGYRDDWYALCFANLYMNGKNAKVGDLGGGAHCNRVTVTPKDKDWIDPVTKGDDFWHHISGDVQARYCLDGHFYLRKEPDPKTGSCRATGTPPDPAVCGEFTVSYIKSSPISLLWEPGAHIDDRVSVVRFPIDPAHPNNFVAWKASERTPLLVYDPRHTGSITQASQLFGNWTFGGKQVASLSISGVADTAWAHGFEALATLDADGNGKVDNDELAPLALWFDRDQDGVSDSGEVVPVTHAGVVALYYNASAPTSGRDIHLSLGFERTVGGRVVKGGSVDWYGGHAESKFEVLGHHLLGKPGAPATAPGSLKIPGADVASPKAHAALAGRNPFAGMWEWKFDEHSSEPPGHLILSGAHAEPEVVQGYSMVTMPFAKAPSPDLGSLVTFYFVKGRRSAEGNIHKMTFRSDFGKSRTENEATLSADGASMVGKTKAYIVEEGGVREVTYTWSANRVSQP